MPETPTGKLEYRGLILPLDVLRGVGVLTVVLAHAFYDSPYVAPAGSLRQILIKLTSIGGLAVVSFFALSGFLITGILLDSLGKPQYWKNYYIRRALRILPAYVLLLVALKLAHVVSSRFVLAAALYIANMARLVGARAQEYGVLWTLAVEEQFYLFWPFVVRYLSRDRLRVLLIAGVLLTPVFRFLLASHGIEVYLNTPSNIDCIVSGALLAVLLRDGTIHRGNVRAIYRLLGAASALAFVPLLYNMYFPFGGRTAAVLLATFQKVPMYSGWIAFALWAIARRRRGGPAPGPSMRFFLFFSDISYGLYLVHQLIFLLYDRYTSGTILARFPGSFGWLVVRCLLAGGIAVGIAWLSRRYYEDPFLRLKDKFASYKGDAAKVSDPKPGLLPGAEAR